MSLLAEFKEPKFLRWLDDVYRVSSRDNKFFVDRWDGSKFVSDSVPFVSLTWEGVPVDDSVLDIIQPDGEVVHTKTMSTRTGVNPWGNG